MVNSNKRNFGAYKFYKWITKLSQSWQKSACVIYKVTSWNVLLFTAEVWEPCVLSDAVIDCRCVEGLAQCAELCWQLRGSAGKRQVKNAKVALQHNIGLGGLCVVTMYRHGFPDAAAL